MSEQESRVKASGSKLRSGSCRYTTEEIQIIQEHKRLQKEYIKITRTPTCKKNLNEILDHSAKLDEENVSSDNVLLLSHTSSDSDDSVKIQPIKTIFTPENFKNEASLHLEQAKLISTSESDQEGENKLTSTPLHLKTLLPASFDISKLPTNSIDDLHTSNQYQILRQSLIKTEEKTDNPKMNPDPNNGAQGQNLNRDIPFPDSSFYKAIPEFSGNIRELQHFISCCDYFYELLDENNKRIFYLALVRKLKGKAFDLYNNNDWHDWVQFKAALKTHFRIHKSFETLQMELTNVSQDNMNVRDYSHKVDNLLHELNLIGKDIRIHNVSGENYFKIQNEKLAIKAFVNGLKSSIKQIIKPRKFDTLEEAITDAIEIETDENIIARTPIFCTYCKQTNHTVDKCFRRQNNNQRNNNYSNNSQSNNFNRPQQNNYGTNQYNSRDNNNRNNNYNNNNNNNFRNNNNNNTNTRNNNYNNNNRNNNYNNNGYANNRNGNYNGNSSNYSQRNGNTNNNNNNNNNNSNQTRDSNQNQRSSRVQIVEADPKNESPQTAIKDNADLNFLLN